MTRWQQMMLDYGSAHRNRINVWMHVVGVPIIVLGVLTTAAAASTTVAGITVSGAWLVAVAGLVFYWGLDRNLTAVIAPVMLVEIVLAQAIASAGASAALAWGIGMFVGGFVFQFIGHAIEGRKPALMNGNPIVAMMTAPLFIVAELLFVAGKRADLEDFLSVELARLDAAGADAADAVPVPTPA